MCPKNKEEEKDINTISYAPAIGSLIYSITSTRLVICYAVGLFSWSQSNPIKEH